MLGLQKRVPPGLETQNGRPNPAPDEGVKRRQVTPDMAKVWLETAPFESQRTLREDHVLRLAEAIERDEFAVSTIMFFRWQGRSYLVDGQHRLHAIQLAAKPVDLIVAEFEAESFSEILTAYMRLDRGMGRTEQDCARAARIHESVGLSLRQVGEVERALKVLIHGFVAPTQDTRRHAKSIDALHRGVTMWKDEAHAFYRAIEGGIELHQKQLVKPPVLAVALITFRYQPVKAAEFWKRCAERDRLEAQTGEWHLAEIVREEKHPLALPRRVASAWNAFYHNRRIRGTQIRDTARGIHIDGTPFRRHQVNRETF